MRTGNDLANTLSGTNDSADTLSGGAGDDVLFGRGGNDTLIGGAGIDELSGGDGDDTFVLGADLDKIIDVGVVGQDFGNDTIVSTISRGLKDFNFIDNITLSGTAAVDAIGNEFANVLTGNDAANALDGGAGLDTLQGGLGNDTYLLGGELDHVIDTGGIDTIVATRTLSLANFTGVENLTVTGSSALSLFGNAGANTLVGNTGANTLDGGAGIDVLRGGIGNDIYVLSSDRDVVQDVGGTHDTVISSVTRSLASFAGIEDLRLTGAGTGTGNRANNIITGGTKANKLDGAAGNDVLNGAAGNDILIGNAGKDVLTGGVGNDVFTFVSRVHSSGKFVDTLLDFDDRGNDRIDLSKVFGGKLSFIGDDAFTKLGQVHVKDVAGPDVIVEVNTVGSLAADVSIRLSKTSLASMTASDFVL
jgi:serralysin